MNQIAERTEQGISYKSVGIAQADGGGVLMPANFGEVVAFATMMARSQHAIPKHLRNNDGACMAVTMQALRWGLDPFAVAGKSYSVNDMVAYEAQLITAVVNTRSGIKGRLRYDYEGEGDSRRCTVTGILDGEEYSYTTPTFGTITPKNSPLWKTDPDQQLGYFAGKRWARRYTPEVILGVYDRDEAEEFRSPDSARDVTPQSPVMQRLRANADNAPQMPASEREGFSASSVQQQTDRVLTGDILDDEPHDPETGELTEHPTSDDHSPDETSDSDGAPPPAPSNEPAGELSSSAPAGSSEPEFDPIPVNEFPAIRKFVKIAMSAAISKGMAPDILTKVMNRSINADLGSVSSKSGRLAINQIRDNAKSVLNEDADYRSAIEFYAEMLECETADLMPEGSTDG